MDINPRPHRRRRYLVETKFQLKYVGVILLFMYLTGILCAYFVYYTSMISMGEKLANVYPQGRLVAIVKMVNAKILLSLVLATPLVAILGILLSHRVAGPWFRMERFLTGVASGDLTSIITLRRKDDLIPLANKMNAVVERFRNMIRTQKSRLATALAEFKQIKTGVDTKSQDLAAISRNLINLEAQLRDIEKELDNYKL